MDTRRKQAVMSEWFLAPRPSTRVPVIIANIRTTRPSLCMLMATYLLKATLSPVSEYMWSSRWPRDREGSDLVNSHSNTMAEQFRDQKRTLLLARGNLLSRWHWMDGQRCIWVIIKGELSVLLIVVGSSFTIPEGLLLLHELLIPFHSPINEFGYNYCRAMSIQGPRNIPARESYSARDAHTF